MDEWEAHDQEEAADDVYADLLRRCVGRWEILRRWVVMSSDNVCRML